MKLRTYFLEGLVFIVPVFLTLYILRLVFRMIFGFISSAFVFFPESLISNQYIFFAMKLLFLAGSLLILALIGLIAQTLFGRSLSLFLQKIIDRIPVVSSVFSTVKDFVLILFSGKSDIFSHPVIIDYPFKGRKTVGFNTGPYIVEGSKKKFCTVYIPTVPFPTTGFTYIIEEKLVRPLDYDTESVIKLIFSAGIISKSKRALNPPKASSMRKKRSVKEDTHVKNG